MRRKHRLPALLCAAAMLLSLAGCGGGAEVNHKFAMLESVLEQLKEGDVGIIDVSDGYSAHFIPQ